MKIFLTFAIAGLATGSIYGLAATGLVLTYKTSGVFNLAHGAVGAVGAFAFYEFRDHVTHLPWPIAGFLALVISGPLLGILLERVAGGLRRVSPSMKIVATVGLLLAIEGAATIRYGGADRYFGPFLPTRTIELIGVKIGVDQMILVGVAGTLLAGLYVLFRTTRIGVAMRAVVDDGELVSMVGTNPVAVQRVAWMIGCTFAAMSGILLAPQVGLNAVLLTLLVFQAFGGAAIGRFDNLPLTYVGGLVVGIASSLALRYIGTVKALSGLPSSMPFIILFLALIIMRERRPQEAKGAPWAASVASSSRQVRAAGLVVAAVVLTVVPFAVGTRIPVYTNALIYAVLFLSLGFLVGTSGQISLCHLGFAAVGAVTIAHLTGDGVPWAVSLLAAGVLAMVVGAAVAIPAIRLSGLYLALATFGFGLLLQNLLYGNKIMFGTGVGVRSTRPHLPSLSLASDKGFYYVVLIVFALSAAAVIAVQRSRLGRLLRGMADAPVALSTAGTSVRFIRIAAFAVSAFFAGIAGALIASLSGNVNTFSFQPIVSLTLLAVLAIAGAGTVKPALMGAIGFTIVPSYIHGAKLGDWLTVVFGVSALVVALVSGASRNANVQVWLRGAATRARERGRSTPLDARRAAPVGSLPQAAEAAS